MSLKKEKDRWEETFWPCISKYHRSFETSIWPEAEPPEIIYQRKYQAFFPEASFLAQLYINKNRKIRARPREFLPEDRRNLSRKPATACACSA